MHENKKSLWSSSFKVVAAGLVWNFYFYFAELPGISRVGRVGKGKGEREGIGHAGKTGWDRVCDKVVTWKLDPSIYPLLLFGVCSILFFGCI